MNNNMDILKLVAEKIESFDRLMKAFTKEYTNTHHVMKEKIEILIPSDNEKYTFYKTENWKVIQDDDNVIVIEKV